MTQEFSESNEKLAHKFNFTHEELKQIVKAVSAGKYSWACVLILRFSGYNPLEYIPARTYIRLIKNNCLFRKANRHQTDYGILGLFKLESTWIQGSSAKRSSN
ncbi:MULTISPECIES: HetP family heterocyst commitment protein [unclassified Nostoc]|uniref:HetP family heterocyst commitment protein n=1 Tax=unclassified Nostoc TaxID=2593658 RepID=UPI002AD3DF90|nr:HetP family heterocyst commitment protein [Nostoc sp. ChiQUE02]MDZ8231194.1 HetP family heterocyst commitment protein [Nostoc sp. ChiQUE02]